MEVITSYGMTERFTTEDGIDQGEVISPLIWRIFYDPLLVAIQRKENAGYKMEVRWSRNLQTNEMQVLTKQIPVIAYADDTTYIANSKCDLEEILEIADDFYKINDIEINNKKSELLIIGAKNKEEAAEGVVVGRC